jgi:hypothetical protein
MTLSKKAVDEVEAEIRYRTWIEKLAHAHSYVRAIEDVRRC